MGYRVDVHDAWNAILHALRITGSMTWQVTWSLILGFTLSAMIEALVRKSTIARLLPDDRPRSLATATGAGRGVVLLLLRRGGARAIAGPQGRELHLGDGLPVRVHQPGHRTRA